MRTSIMLATALAATALAKPVEKRSEVVVTTVDVVYTTAIVTVTAGQSAAATGKTSSARKHHHRPSKQPSLSSYPAPATSSQAPPPVQTTSQAPAPVPTSSEAPAPAPSSYSPPAQSSSAAPAPEVSKQHHHHPIHHHQSPAHAKRAAAAKKVKSTTTTTTTKKKSPATSNKPTSTKAPAPKPTTTSIPKSAPKPTTTPSKVNSASVKASTKSTAKPTSTGGTASTYQQAVVNHHNYHRANHSASDIVWDQGLADTAMKIAQTCVYGHSMNVDGGGYGQNIAAGVGASEIGRTISDLFYNGEVSKFTGYGQKSPDTSGFEGWGHFSQIVWKDTTKVGCATWNCNAKGLQYFVAETCDDTVKENNCYSYYTVCNYNPAGNVGGEFGTKIGASLNKATVLGSANVNTEAIKKSYCGATGQHPN